MRVVSLVPSATETLLALGADVVACTRFCEQPGIAHVGGTKNPDVAAVVALGPDLVVMDREENRIEDHDALVAAGVQVFVSDVRSVADAVAFVGDLSTVVSAPATVFEMCRARVEHHDTTGARRRAFVPIWRRPWMSIGSDTYGASVLDHLAIDLVTMDAADPYPTVDLHELEAQRPDLVLVPSEPYEFGDPHLDELAAAFPRSHILRIDGRDLFWWGVRTPAALERLAEALGPV